MEKNNLEKRYQEKLKDFREIPDEKVWSAISASLDKKKKKRVVPIWWKLGGVAALLALLFYVVNPFEDNSIPVNKTTDIESSGIEKLNDLNKKQKLVNDTINKIDNTSVTEAEEDKKDDVVNKIEIANTNSNKTNPTVTSISSTKDGVIDSAANNVQKQNTENKGQVVLAENQNQETKKQIGFKKSTESSKTNAVVVEAEKENTVVTKKQNLDTPLSNKKEAVATTIDAEVKDDKKSIFDAIKAQEEDVALVEYNENKWSVGPSIAPVYFNALGTGSPIHPNFTENSKSGNINLSYGLTVAYDLGKRLKVRSGIHKVDYGYDTNEVVFSSSLAANNKGTLDNINVSKTSRTIVVESKKASDNIIPNSNTDDFSAQSPARDGRMSQQLGYLEVPVELNYVLVDKKVGVNLIGGFSSLFLVDNSVSLQSEGLITEIGEANNVNTVNFSTNIGVGFSYEFSPKVQINLEPVIKYQLNTFSETAGNFNPYAVGVYSGLRFNF